MLAEELRATRPSFSSSSTASDVSESWLAQFTECDVRDSFGPPVPLHIKEKGDGFESSSSRDGSGEEERVPVFPNQQQRSASPPLHTLDGLRMRNTASPTAPRGIASHRTTWANATSASTLPVSPVVARENAAVKALQFLLEEDIQISVAMEDIEESEGAKPCEEMVCRTSTAEQPARIKEVEPAGHCGNACSNDRCHLIDSHTLWGQLLLRQWEHQSTEPYLQAVKPPAASKLSQSSALRRLPSSISSPPTTTLNSAVALKYLAVPCMDEDATAPSDVEDTSASSTSFHSNQHHTANAAALNCGAGRRTGSDRAVAQQQLCRLYTFQHPEVEFERSSASSEAAATTTRSSSEDPDVAEEGSRMKPDGWDDGMLGAETNHSHTHTTNSAGRERQVLLELVNSGVEDAHSPPAAVGAAAPSRQLMSPLTTSTSSSSVSGAKSHRRAVEFSPLPMDEVLSPDLFFEATQQRTSHK